MPHIKTLQAKGMAPSARGRGATIQLRPTKPSFLSRVKLAHAPRRVGARCLGGGVALELAERARRAKLIMIGVGSVIWRCTDDRRVFIGARPWCDVPAVASNTKPDASCRRRVGARCLGGGGVLLELAERARRAKLLMAYGRRRACHMALCRREACLLRRVAVVRRASYGSQVKPAAHV